MIVDVLDAAGIGWDDLDGLGVTVGPGTFTGVRVGLAAVRGIALVRRLPVAGVSSLHALAAGARRRGLARPGEAVLAAVDARRGEVYVQDFAADDAPLGPPELRAAARIADGAPQGPLVLVGSGAAVHRSELAVARAEHAHEPDAVDVALLAAAAMAAPGWTDPGPPRPLYLRAPDARLKRGPTPGPPAHG